MRIIYLFWSIQYPVYDLGGIGPSMSTMRIMSYLE